MKRFLALVGMSTLAAAAFVLPVGSSTAGAADQAVYAVHGIPGVPVDVCVAGTKVITDFQPGETAGPLAPAPGNYVVELVEPGDPCGDPIYKENLDIPAGSSTIVAWSTTAEITPDLAVFANDVTCTQPGTGRITARHAAGAAGPVNVFANGGVAVPNLAPGTQAVLNVPVGKYSVEVKLVAGGATVLGPADITAVEGKNVIVHVVNALEKGGQPASAIVLTIDVGVCAATVVEQKPAFTG